MTMQTAPFLALPAELRIRIYNFVLVKGDEHDSINILNLRDPHEERNVLAILAVCRQIRSEAHAIYYTSNRFNFFSPECLETRLPALFTNLARHASRAQEVMIMVDPTCSCLQCGCPNNVMEATYHFSTRTARVNTICSCCYTVSDEGFPSEERIVVERKLSAALNMIQQTAASGADMSEAKAALRHVLDVKTRYDEA